MDEKTLKQTAFLSRLKVAENEIQPMLDDFNKILKFIDQIKEIDTSNVSENDLYPQMMNEFRKDEAESSVQRENLSKISPKFENGYVVVPKVIET
jgi:aspartyl-tRNA(Asn)/glutamyl-tRNA(Gln) amidotransferase subunit C